MESIIRLSDAVRMHRRNMKNAGLASALQRTLCSASYWRLLEAQLAGAV